MNRVEIKNMAKERLGNSIFSNQWMYALLAYFVVSMLTTIVSGIPAVGGAVALVIGGPLLVELSRLFLKQVREGGSMQVNSLFDGFKKDFSQSFLLYLMAAIFVALWSMLFLIPGIIKAYAYSMAFYIKADNPTYTWKECLDESKRITDGHKAELFVLDLSFIGWYFVGALCFGIGTLWVKPYHEASRALYYEAIRCNYGAETVEYAEV